MGDNPISDVIRSTGVPALIDTTREFIEKLLGPSAEEGGEVLRDLVKSYRWKNQLKILERARDYAAHAGMDITKVPLRTLVPLLENAGLEETPELQTLWAGLLTSAGDRRATGMSKTGSVEIMRQLGPVDAWILSGKFARWGLPIRTTSARTMESLSDECPYERPEVDAALGNLLRVGLLRTDHGAERNLRDLGKAVGALMDAVETGATPRPDISLRQRMKDLGSGRGGTPSYYLTTIGSRFLHAALPPLPRPWRDPWDADTAATDLRHWAFTVDELARDFEWDPELSEALRASGARADAEFRRRLKEVAP